MDIVTLSTNNHSEFEISNNPPPVVYSPTFLLPFFPLSLFHCQCERSFTPKEEKKEVILKSVNKQVMHGKSDLEKLTELPIPLFRIAAICGTKTHSSNIFLVKLTHFLTTMLSSQKTVFLFNLFLCVIFINSHSDDESQQ